MNVRWPGKVLYAGLFLLAATASGRSQAETALPFDMPSTEILRQSPKKVFAHYVPWFPISRDNLPAEVDHYATQHLDPDGSGGAYQGCGGLIRARPIPQAPVNDPDWQLRNMEKDVRRAITVGIDGFAVSIVTTSGAFWDNVILLLRAAANVDPGFKILLRPNMNAVFKDNPELLRPTMIALSQYPAAFRLADGRLVISPFDSEKVSSALWGQWLTMMRNSGVDVAFVPLFQGWRDYASDYQSISAGFADWGTASAVAAQQDSWRLAPIDAHQFLPIWMAPVRPQVFWPCNYSYWESGGSLLYRKTWTTAILGKADWVQILTWNDYAESTQVAPSTQTQHAFHDLTAYYVTWFKTGKMPTITRDVIYYFHRLQHTMAVPDWSQQAAPMRFRKEWSPEARRDQVEVVAFLKEPGTVEIRTGGAPQSFSGNTGQNFFTVPIAEGRPSFRLLRKGGRVLDFQSAFTISNSILYQDLMYRGGSSSRTPVATQ
jgi:hypothetical protein